MLRALQILFFACWGLSSLTAFAQNAEPAADPYLAAAVEALGRGDHQLGLELLQKASSKGADPRITYYTAFALEKVGRCGEARAKYEEALAAGPPRFTASATSALEGLDARCVAVKPVTPATADLASRPLRRSPTLATVGWVLTTVGGLTLLAVPVKVAFDREVATQSEQYFEQVYECDVDFGKLADDCDAEAIKANPQWETYEKRIITAKQGNIWMLVGGSALVAGGITAVVIGSAKQTVAVVPTAGGAMVKWVVSF